MTKFLQVVQSAMQGRFQSDPVLMENVVSVDVIDTRFIVVTHVQVPSETGYDSHYLCVDAELDDNDIAHQHRLIYAYDEADQNEILTWILGVANTVGDDGN